MKLGCPMPTTSPQPDRSSVSECSAAGAMKVIRGGKKTEVYHGSKLFRLGLMLYLCLAVVLLLAAMPPVVRAQEQIDTTSATATSPSNSHAKKLEEIDIFLPPGPQNDEISDLVDEMPNFNDELDEIHFTEDTASSNEESLSPKPTSLTMPSITPVDTPKADTPSSRFNSMETRFRQEFEIGTERIGRGREFNDDEINLLQSIYEGYTVDFLVPNEIEAPSNVTTTCTVERQNLLCDSTRLSVDFTMKYESSYYNVLQYPKLFHTWINLNLNTMLEQMQDFDINVSQVDIAKRIVVAVPEEPGMGMVAEPEEPGISMVAISEIPGNISMVAIPEKPGNISMVVEPEEPGISMVAEPEEPGISRSLTITMVSFAVGLAFLTLLLIGLFFWFRNPRVDKLGDSGVEMTEKSKVQGVSEPCVESAMADPNQQVITVDTLPSSSSDEGDLHDVPI